MQLTLAEVVNEIVTDPDDFSQLDAVERAVRDLAKGGVVHQGVFIVPTRTAFLCRDLSIESCKSLSENPADARFGNYGCHNH